MPGAPGAHVRAVTDGVAERHEEDDEEGGGIRLRLRTERADHVPREAVARRRVERWPGPKLFPDGRRSRVHVPPRIVAVEERIARRAPSHAMTASTSSCCMASGHG
jgi:hypothetical protein